MTWSLPPEITGHVVSLLANPLSHINSKLELAQYASVNRDWQASVEERSWATLRVKTGTPLNLDQFERLTNDPRRQSYIRNIELIVELEPYDEAARAHFETESEHERNNQIFSEAIRSVLQLAAHIHLLPSSIKFFSFTFNNEQPQNHDFSPDNITDQGVDALSSRLYGFSQQLVRLGLYGMTIGNELFWQPGSSDKHRSWPNLKTVDLQYTPSTPSGKWIFVDRSDRDEYDHYESSDSDPHDEFPEYVRTVLEDRSGKPFREVSVSGLFNELYMAVGQAALFVPKLEFLIMETESGRDHHRFRYSSDEAYANWSDLLGFQPEERVLKLWKQVASKNTGGDLTVKLCND